MHFLKFFGTNVDYVTIPFELDLIILSLSLLSYLSFVNLINPNFYYKFYLQFHFQINNPIYSCQLRQYINFYHQTILISVKINGSNY